MNRISFNYTQGEAFTGPNFNSPQGDNVEDYTGYYNITDNLIYSGREATNNSVLLAKKDNVLANYIDSRYFFDRATNENIELTYNAESLVFQPSEYVNQNSINEKLKMLDDNFLDLYNFCFIRDNNLPTNYTSYIGVTGSGDDYLTTSSILNLPNFSTSDVGLLSANGFEVIGMNLDTSDGYNSPSIFLLIYFTPTTLLFFKADNTNSQSNITFLLSSDRADGTFSQPYVNITDITTNNVDTLFVTDSYHNQIYRLYIDPILKESRIANNNFALLGTGGIKLTTGGTEFLSGSNLVYYFNDEVYTYNEGTKNITVLDDNLTYRRAFTNKDLTDNLVADFAANPIDNKLYILLDNFKILEIDTGFTTEASISTPDNVFEVGEEPRRLLFSGNDSNVYYLITTKNVYKYLNKSSDDFIGSFKWYNTTAVAIPSANHEIFDAKILPENQNYDSLFIFDKNTTYNGVDKLLRFSETNNLITCLEKRNFKTFDTNDILVRDQYFNNITFNKSLKKLIFNLDNLTTNIQSQFTYLYNTNKDLVYESNLVLSENINVDRDYNFFVGVNETITPQVFNRCVNRIYNYQQTILETLKKQIKNLKYPYTEVVTF
jgi:hypothetical protein